MANLVNPIIPFEFFPMTEYPSMVNPESEGAFSVQVILYDKDDIQNVFIGHYHYEMGKWVVYSESDCEFLCWCYPHSPNLYLQIQGRANRKGKIVGVINNTEEPTLKTFSDFLKDKEHERIFPNNRIPFDSKH